MYVPGVDISTAIRRRGTRFKPRSQGHVHVSALEVAAMGEQQRVC